MVRLEKIAFQGFKSFKRKTVLPIPPGFSVITGPNGSGKTNISDGISFVIGRASPRLLRVKKASELIFHGSKGKGPAEYAKVGLFFDNSDRSLPFDEQIVSVSRRLNRAGISTYRLNGKIVTRQQILDVLAQIGLRPDSHNIIQQGDVNRVVEMDAIERRQIIDSVAGISEYDEKKEQAQKELESIQTKIREAELLLGEKQTIVEKLRAEREAALTWQELQKDLRLIRAAIIIKEHSQIDSELAEIKAKLAEKEKISEQLGTEIAKIDSQLKIEEAKLEQLSRDVIAASERLQIDRQIDRLNAEIEIKRSKIDSNKREIERARAFIKKFERNAVYDLLSDIKGVYGTVDKLLSVPEKYRIAFEVAIGSHLGDIVVENLDTAVECIKRLKEKRIGQARFLPISNLKISQRTALPKGGICWLADVITGQPKFKQVAEWLGGRTAVMPNIESAKAAVKTETRLVTLDGDVFEVSGSVTGGFYQRAIDSQFVKQIEKLEEENRELETIIKAAQAELAVLKEKQKKAGSIKIEIDKSRLDERLKKIRQQRLAAYEKRLALQQEIGKLNIQKARLEAKAENLDLQINQIKEEKNDFIQLTVNTLKQKEKEITEQLAQLGPVNLKAIDDFELIFKEFDSFKQKLDKIVAERAAIEQTIAKIEAKRLETFLTTLNEISKHFKDVYKELTGGQAELELEEPGNLASGLLIKASPPGKKLINIDAMSAGEKTLTAFAFLFAIQRHKPAPFYVLDEADATLDKTNSKRIAELLKKQSKLAQFIVISHNDIIIREADQIYGVTMDDGESKILAIKLPEN
jgi:chromosome segregation protein